MRTNKKKCLCSIRKNFIFVFNAKNVHIKFNVVNLPVVNFNVTDFKPKKCVFSDITLADWETTKFKKLTFSFFVL